MTHAHEMGKILFHLIYNLMSSVNKKKHAIIVEASLREA